MGVIVKQSIKNTLFSYTGIVVGALYTVFLIPKVFDSNPNEWGLIQLLNSYVFLFMPLAMLGTSSTIIKYWSRLDDKDKKGFTSFVWIVVLTGLVIVSLGIYLFHRQIFFSGSGQNLLIKKYYVYFTESLSALPAVNFGIFAAGIVII